MKFNITLNLLKMQEHNLSVNQWCILDIISTAPTWCEVIIFKETPYFWISKTKILEELKVLELKEDTIYRHLKTLKELGFIEYEKDHKKDLIKLTELGKTLFVSSDMNPNSDKNSEINPTKLGNKSEKNSEINPTYNNTSIYNNTKYKKENIKEKEFTFALKKLTEFENLTDEYKIKLEEEIKNLNKYLSYEDFTISLMAKGYKYKNFLLAYKTWVKNDNKKYQQPQQKTKQQQNNDFIDEYFYNINKRNEDVIEVDYE